MEPGAVNETVIPAKAGIQERMKPGVRSAAPDPPLDSGFRRNDECGRLQAIVMGMTTRAQPSSFALSYTLAAKRRTSAATISRL